MSIMKRLGTFALVTGLLAFALLFASGWTTLVPPVADFFAQQSQQEKPQRSQLRTFTGKISRNGQQFVLEDASTKVSYKLDEQKKAKQFAGKNVRVTGAWNAENNLIHVETIEEAV